MPYPRVIAIGDVHGDLGRLARILMAVGVINKNFEWIGGDTIVVQVGDQIDSASRTVVKDDWERMPDTDVLTFMDRLDLLASVRGGHVFSLIGNHELMNVMGQFMYVSEFSASPMRAERFKPGGDLARLLAKRLVILQIGDVIFCHAGITPEIAERYAGRLHLFNIAMSKFLLNLTMTPDEADAFQNGVMDPDNGVLWTRRYMSMSNEEIERVLKATGAKHICVGHNTVSQITASDPDARIVFIDAMLSRSYGSGGDVQVLEILDGGKIFRTIEVKIEKGI